MIRFENVSKRYDGGHEALSGVSIEVAAGELAFLTGRSGAGKSTVLKLVALIERPTRGQVIVGGRQLNKLRVAMSASEVVDQAVAFGESA